MKKDLLIVDDDGELCETLTGIMQEEGFSVDCAPSGSEALEMATTREYASSLINLILPDMDGLLLMKEFKERYPEMGASIITGNASKENAIEALRYGADDYFVKPVDIREVARRTVHMLEKYRLSSDLAESKERYQSLFESGSEATVVFDAETLKIEDVNRAAVNLFGYGLDEFFRLTALDISPGWEGDTSTASLTEPPQGSNVLSTLDFIRKDGSIFSGEMSTGSFIVDARRKIMTSLRDVTLRKCVDATLRQEAKIAEMLLSISEATLTMTDMERLMGDVVTSMERAAERDIILSYIWDREGAIFRPVEGKGFDGTLNPFFRSEVISADFAFIRKPLDTGKVSLESLSNEDFSNELKDSELFKWLGEISTVSFVPLKEGRRYHGLIVCICKCKNVVYGAGCAIDLKVEHLQSIANHVSTALEKVYLLKEPINSSMELSRKVETIQTMSEISKSILSTHESEFILETTIRMITRLVACDLVRVIVVSREKEELHFNVGFEEDATSRNKTVQFSETNLTEVLLTGLPQYLPHMDHIEDPLYMEKDLLANGFYSVLRVPIVIKEEVFGVLGVISRRPSAFTVEDSGILEKLASQIGIALENSRLIKDLEDLLVNTVKTLAGTIEAKSRWTRGHSDRVTKIALGIGEELGLIDSELMDLKLAGLLHDIGKIGTYEMLLDKPGKLTREETAIVSKHPNKGADLLMPIKQFANIIPGVRYHHECFDGSGYPDGLAGEEIPFIARILAVADTIDAMGADRPYRRGLSIDIIVGELRRCSNTQFDPVVVEAFFRILKGTDDKKLSDTLAV